MQGFVICKEGFPIQKELPLEWSKPLAALAVEAAAAVSPVAEQRAPSRWDSMGQRCPQSHQLLNITLKPSTDIQLPGVVHEPLP